MTPRQRLLCAICRQIPDRLNVPAARRHAIDTIVKLELDGPANTIPILREG